MLGRRPYVSGSPVRSKIIKEHLNDPAYYEKMSALLDEIIAARKAKAIDYEEYRGTCQEGRCRPRGGDAKNIGQMVKKIALGDIVIIHLLEPTHNPQFIRRMDHCLPQWRN